VNRGAWSPSHRRRGERAGVMFDGRLVDLPISPRSLLDLIDDWPEAEGNPSELSSGRRG